MTTIGINDINQHKLLITRKEYTKKNKSDIISKYEGSQCILNNDITCTIQNCSLGKCSRVQERFYSRDIPMNTTSGKNNSGSEHLTDKQRIDYALNRTLAKRQSRGNRFSSPWR